MAVERGLPSVPQGLPRGLTVYLQNLHAYLLRLAGNVRGAADSQAVRRAEIAGYSKSSAPGENSVTAAMVRDGAVTTEKIANKAVTGKKIADATIEGGKLVQGTIGTRELGAGAVTSDGLKDGAVVGAKIADGVVSAAKLEKGLLTVTAVGEAEDGATVEIPGVWTGEISVCVSGFYLPAIPAGANVEIRAANLRQAGKRWFFDAVARAVVPAEEVAGTEKVIMGGKMFWAAVGRQGNG